MKNAADRAIREMCLEVCKRAIEKCSRIYGFDSSEAIEKLDLDSLCVVSKRVKDKNVKKNDVVGPSFHLPFCGVKIEGRCEGIRSNWTLLTQCMNVPSNGILCKSCEKEGEKNASGEPNLGLITKRIEMGDDFVDPKGRTPTHYSKYMEKHSLTEEAVIAEASKYGIVVDHSYLMTPTAHKNTKKNDSKVGRPQKERIPIEVNENAKPDLLEEAETLQSIEEEEEEDTEVPVSSPVSPPVSTPVSPPVSAPAPAIVPVKKTKEQKEVPVKKTKEQKEAEKEAEKQRKEAEKEAEKQRKEAEKEAEKQRKEAEKKAEKERKKAEKKTEKKAEKKTEKKTTVKKTKESVIEPEYVITDELTREPYDENSNSNEDEEEEVTVKNITLEGVEYYWDINSNELYDKDTNEIIGMYINGKPVFNSDGNDDEDEVESENEDEEDEEDEDETD